MSTDVFTLHSSDPTFHYIRNSNCFFNMQILSSTNHTNSDCRKCSVFLYVQCREMSSKRVSSTHREPGFWSQPENSKRDTPFLHISKCLFAVYFVLKKYQATRSSPAHSATFDMTTVSLPHSDNDFEIHLAFQFPSCFFQQLHKWCQHIQNNSVSWADKHRVNRSLFHRVIPKKRLAYILKL